jgi:hypothetical protein
MHYLFSPDKFFFNVFAIIKNFILSPLFTGVIYILTKVAT